MDHNPKITFLVLLKFDEVVAASKRTNLMEYRMLTTLYNLHLINIVTLWQILCILSLFVMIHSEWDSCTDALHDFLTDNMWRQIFHLPIGLYSAHAATNIHANGIRYYCAVTCQHTTDWHSHTSVNVRHDC